MSISIRKFINRILNIDQIRFVAGKPIDVKKERREEEKHLLEIAGRGQLAELLTEAIHNKLNILISGGASSGKTTMARALLSLAQSEERIVTIEGADKRPVMLPSSGSFFGCPLPLTPDKKSQCHSPPASPAGNGFRSPSSASICGASVNLLRENIVSPSHVRNR
ncbi:Flp pilus assembly complex ATPase component TadA [Labrenzia sp. R4_2]|uniref:ATPase, T2SS/T4P/T4SS family n=1 Tax=Labrenzia sp. R4_2 TaxID=2821107 RepID=UPI001ADC67D8|nr:Flp pilus assembly complex ATPase component TadA [Labrenzia sp. R4_2]